MARTQQTKSDEIPPSTSVPPPYTGHHDHSFTLQQIMELQKCVGKFEAQLDAQTKQLEKIDVSIDKLSGDVSKHNKIVFAAGVVMTILLALGSYIVDKSVSFGLEMAKQKFEPPTAVVQPAKK